MTIFNQYMEKGNVLANCFTSSTHEHVIQYSNYNTLQVRFSNLFSRRNHTWVCNFHNPTCLAQIKIKYILMQFKSPLVVFLSHV